MNVTVKLWKDGERDIAVLAAQSRISERQVYRRLAAAGLRPGVKPPMRALDQHPRALMLLAEGMPATWVAEDTGVPYNTVLHLGRQLPNRTALAYEWKIVWQEIRKNEELLKHHYEIAAPSWRTVRAENALAA